MAIGDKAAAKGMHVVANTDGVPVGYQDINRVSDAVADEQDARVAADNKKMDKTYITVQNATPPATLPDGSARPIGSVWIKSQS